MIFYRLITILLLPVISFYLIIRIFKKKEDFLRIKERFGISSLKRPEGEIFWIHTVSVGEANSALILIEEILKKSPKLTILFTSATVTSATQIKNKTKNEPRIIHQFLPIDEYFSVRRFIKYWQPKIAIFVESEIWPNLIDVSAKNSIKIALINARISDKSFKRWQIFSKMGENIFKHFSLCFAQSSADKEKWQNLGLKNVKFVGNLKSCAKPLPFKENDLVEIKKQIGTRKFWLAASTHRGEEEIIFRIHEKLRQYLPDLLTIIVPRHPNRINEILNLPIKDIKYALRSKKEIITKETQIYFADSLGEMGLFYKLSDIALICGSLKDEIGGHNPFEALELDSSVITGKYVANFLQIYEELEQNKSCKIAKNEDEIFYFLLRCLKDQKFLKSMRKSWQKRKNHDQNILPIITKDIFYYT